MRDGERRARRVAAGLVAAGFVLNPWWVARLLTSDGSIDDAAARAAIAALDVAAVAAGVALWRRRALPKRRSVALALVTLLLSVLAVETGLHAFDWLRHRGDDPRDPRRLLSPYAGREWADELFAEQGDERGTGKHYAYHPHLGWVLKPFRGRYVQTDERGIRRTWIPPDLPASPETLYVFGGSTVWGVGARDDFTLPSQLARTLARRGHALAVQNYGQLGYNSSQDLINLVLLLRDGHRPDYAIFYDGVNDVYGAHQKGVAGDVLDVLAMGGVLERRFTPGDHLKLALRGFLTDHSMIYRSLRRIPALLSPPPMFSEAGTRMSDAELRGLARAVVDHYQATRTVIDHLARSYGFRYLTFWQPVTFTEAKLFDEERLDPRGGDEALGKLHRYALDELRRRELAHFVDVADALADRAGTTYIDYCHLSEEGNRIVAERIADAFLDAYPEAGRSRAGVP